MKPVTYYKARGFSMIELLLAMAIGLIVIAAATSLFNTAMTSTTLITEETDMQQNVRAALNMIAKDVSMAGSGLPSGGLALPYGAGATASRYGCNQGGQCYLSTLNYPSGTVGTSVVSNYMYGLIPGPNNGMEAGTGITTVPATGNGADSITSVYVDYSFPLNQYIATFASNNSVTFAPPANPPVGFPGVISPTGLNVGDLVLLTNNLGSAVGEVTGLTPGNSGGATVTFANLDALNINQTGAANGSVAYISGGSPTVAYRLWAVSYFLEVPTTAGQTPRLMRQVNGQNAVPMADNIIGLNFTYDTCDNTNTNGVITCAGLNNPINSGYTPNQIHKVNIQVMGQSVLSPSGKSVSMALVTSVSTRSLSFKSRYN
jgi:prepilin-type N-terminal cleavage/methylation domain-containing protein